MRRMVKRFGGVILAILLFGVSIIPVHASPEEQDAELILVTDEMAINIANTFAEAIAPDENLIAKNPLKLYDESGQAIGYVVDFFENETPHGYVIFDNTSDTSFAEFSLSEDTKNPYVTIKETQGVSTCSDAEEKIYKLDAVTYGINISENELITNYGEEVQLNSIENYSGQSDSGKEPHKWEEVFFTSNQVFKDSRVTEQNNIASFYAYNESFVEEQTGRYACAVSAAITCASAYGATNYNNFRNEYLELWDLTATIHDYTGTNGIIYGTTNNTSTGSGVVQFCQARNINLSHNFVNSPSYSFYKTAIDGMNVGIIYAGINTDTGRSGHAMTVEGYMTIKNNSTGVLQQVLIVSDGWGDGGRYLNLGYPYYLDTAGSTFHHNK